MGSDVPFPIGSNAGAQRDEPYTHNQLGYNAAIPPGVSTRAARWKRSVVQHFTQRKVSGSARREPFSLNRVSTSQSITEKITSVVPESLRPGRKQQQDQNLSLGARRFSFVSSPPPRPPPPAPEQQQQAPSSFRPAKRSLSSSEPAVDETAPVEIPTAAKRAKKSQVDLHEVPTSCSPPIPRLSPVLNGIALDQVTDWLRDNPERTTVLDAAVLGPAILNDKPIPRLTPVLNDIALEDSADRPRNNPTRTRALDAAVQRPAIGKDKPTSVELTDPGVPAFAVNPSLTFEALLGSQPPAVGSLGPMHALGLKADGVAVTSGTGSQVRRRPLPANYQGKQQYVAMPAGPSPDKSTRAPLVVQRIQLYDAQTTSPPEPPTHTGKPVQVTPVVGLAGLPSVVRRKELQVASEVTIASASAVASNSSELIVATDPLLAAKRRNAHRQSMRNELHFEHAARPRSFRLPLDPFEENCGLSAAESTQLKRLSTGFLQAGPDLSEAVVEVFEQVRANPPQVDSVRARINAIESGCDDTNGKLMSPISADISLFDGASFPFLDVAARALDAGKDTLRGPLPPGYTSHNGGPPTVNRSAIGDFGWQRFSDQEYVDPAVEDFRLNRRKRLNKRKQDLAAWDAAAAAAAPPPAPLEVKCTVEMTESDLDAAVQVIGHDVPASCKHGSAELTSTPTERLLDIIDFADSSDLSPPKVGNGSLLDDLIQF